MDNKRKWIIIALMIAGLGFFPVMAQAQSKGAVVYKGTSCAVLSVDGKKSLDVSDTVNVPNTVKVTTPSKNCNRNVSCHGVLPEGAQLPEKEAVWNYKTTGYECRVNFDGVWVTTMEWHATISPKGNISLTCHFKGCGSPPSANCTLPTVADTGGNCCLQEDIRDDGTCCPNPFTDPEGIRRCCPFALVNGSCQLL